MADNFRDRFTSLGGRLKVGGAGVSRKMSAGMSTMSGKMKELFQVQTQADKLVEDVIAENLEGPDWSKNMELVDMVNDGKLSGQDVVRAIKKRIASRNTNAQLLVIFLLETCVKNCEKMFSQVASERLLDEMVKVVDDKQTPDANRDKILKLIEAWGEATEELRYLPVYEETYKSLKSRGIKFPGRDVESLAPIFTPPQSVSISSTNFTEVTMAYSETNAPQSKDTLDVARNCVELLSTVLTSSPEQEALHDELTVSLVEQCHSLQFTVQRIAEHAGENEELLCESLSVNDELQKVLNKFEEMQTSFASLMSQPSEPAILPVTRISEEEYASGAPDEHLVKNRAGNRKQGETSAREGFRGVEREKDTEDLIIL